METEVTYRVVRAMGWLGLDVDDTVTLTMNTDSITCDPPIGASQLHSALQLGYLEPDEAISVVVLNQSEAAGWMESLALMCLAPHCHETDRGLKERCNTNARRLSGMIYGAGGSLIGPHSSEPAPNPRYLRLVG